MSASDALPGRPPSPPRRHPTLSFPTLHLGSFDTLSPDSFPSPPLGSSSSSFSRRPPRSASPTRSTFPVSTRDESQHQQSRASGRHSFDDATPGAGADRDEDFGRGSTLPLRIRSSSHHPRVGQPSPTRLAPLPSPLRPKGSAIPPPPLPPPTSSLPPLPTISPVSPLKPPSPAALSSMSSTQQFPTPTAYGHRTVSSSSGPLLAPSLPPLPTPPSSHSPRRPAGPNLTIHIPGRPLTPASHPNSAELDVALPPLKNSPGIPRRRTIIEQAANASAWGAPVQVEGPPVPKRDLPEVTERRSSLSINNALQPILTENMTAEPSRLERKASMEDLKNASPVSPLGKRSLPRPPKERRSSNDLRTVSASHPTLLPAATMPAASTAPNQVTQMAQPSSSWPPVRLNAPAEPSLVRITPVAPPMPPQPTVIQATKQHQPSKSASTLPVVAGLADAGPYGAAALRSTQAGPSTSTAKLGLGMPSQAGPKAVAVEETCLECMMRDRDLADVDVLGSGVWERQSDADFEEMKWREESILQATGGNRSREQYMSSLEGTGVESDGSEDGDMSSSPSASIEHGAAARMRRKMRRDMIDADRGRRRETERRLKSEVRWRGFRWEEGHDGEGLPKGFKGTKPGPLSEAAIKAVMTKWPQASKHRQWAMTNYIRHQSILIQEIQAEARRLGHYPAPGEVPVSSSPSERDQGAHATPRSSSIHWEARHARELSEQMRGALFASPSVKPNLSLMRPSPSSPADLAAPLRNGSQTAKSVAMNRPVTHFIPDREKQPASVWSRYDQEKEKERYREVTRQESQVINIPPKYRERDDEEDLWSPLSPADSGLRPFSFAVRAGAAAGRDGSSVGHGGGRRSFFGKFGGSVTSLFGGSNAGSGSMMDMHLGLDNERGNRAMSSYAHSHPRAVSMASPTRPGFFNQDPASRASSIHNDRRRRSSRLSNSASASRLSQMLQAEESELAGNGPAKKKGIKGFFSKMKPKNKKRPSTSGSGGQAQAWNESLPPSRGSGGDVEHEGSVDLAPPPPLSYLVRQGDRQHNRNRSGSSSSMLTDSQASVGGNRYSGSLPAGLRSVSAPMGIAGSSSSPSASPTSSRYPGQQRESVVSGRRVSAGAGIIDLTDVEGGARRRSSGVELLSTGQSPPNGGFHASPEPYHPDDSRASSRHLPPASFRHHQQPHNKTTSSLSTSSVIQSIDTPPPVHPALYSNNNINRPPSQTGGFFLPPASQQHTPTASTPVVKSAPPGQLSPNRFKNLPPLPVPSPVLGPNSASPDSWADQPDFGVSHPMYDSDKERTYGRRDPNPNPPPHLQWQNLKPSQGYASNLSSPRGSDAYAAYGQPRSSFDVMRRGTGQVSPRLAQSMYVQPSGATGSVGSFGRAGPREAEMGSGGFESGTKGRKGLRGLFGGSAKAGRVA